MKKTILSTKTSPVFLFIFLACGILIGFQNCSPNSSNGIIAKATSDSLTLEVNTTKTISIRFDSSYRTLNSGESIEVLAHAEDANGDIVSDFNYTGVVKISGATDSFVSICGASSKFVNGIFKTNISILNNNTSSVTPILEIQSTVPMASTLMLSVSGQTEETFKLVTPVGNSPVPRSNSTAIYDGTKNRIILFGGREVYEYYGYVQDGNALNDIWELKLSNTNPEWNNITPPNNPSPRYGHTFVLDTTKNRVLLFGGAGLTSLSSTDVWSFDLQEDSWSILSTINTPPRPRMNHGATYDSITKIMYIGGGTEANPSNGVSGSFGLRLGGNTPNWAELPFPTTASATVTAIYNNSQTTFYNQIYPGWRLPPGVSYCGIDPSVPYGCISNGYSVVIDSIQKSQWLIGTLAERAPPRLPQQNYQQYKPVLKVLKKNLRSKLECANSN